MHTTVLGSDEFELTIDGEPATIETLFEGQPHGSLRKLDVYPDHKEIVVPADAESIVRAINDRGITRLLVPGRVPRAPRLKPETRASAERRIRTALVYSRRGRVLRPNVAVTGCERAESFVTAMLAADDADLDAHAIRGALRPPDGPPRESFRRIQVPGALGMLAAIKQSPLPQ